MAASLIFQMMKLYFGVTMDTRGGVTKSVSYDFMCIMVKGDGVETKVEKIKKAETNAQKESLNWENSYR